MDSFIRLQEAILPDWYECLCDSDTNKDSSKKRTVKSVDRTLMYLDQVLERHKNSEVNSRVVIYSFQNNLKFIQVT